METIYQQRLKNINNSFIKEMDWKATFDQMLMKAENLAGGKGDKETCESIAKKHGVDVKVIKEQKEIGMKVEREHTKDSSKIEEIVHDHLMENPKYYTDPKSKNWGKEEIEKGRTPLPIGSVRGKYIKQAEDKWIPIRKQNTQILLKDKERKEHTWNAKKETADREFIIDQLVNSMEHYESEDDFVDHMSGEGVLSVEDAKTVYNDYWNTPAHARLEYTSEDWDEWLIYHINKGEENDIKKARYVDNPENRKKGRVGQEYGGGDKLDFEDQAIEQQTKIIDEKLGSGYVKNMNLGWSVTENEYTSKIYGHRSVKAITTKKRKDGGLTHGFYDHNDNFRRLSTFKGKREEISKSNEGELLNILGVDFAPLDDLLKKEDIEKARSGRYADNPQNKKQGRVGQEYGKKGQEDEKNGGDSKKPTPQEYAESLGADKWNIGKLKREMEHHENMAKLTGDKGHAHVYEHLSKIHKDHPDYVDEDKKEIRERATAKGQATKNKKKKSKQKAEKAANDWSDKHKSLYDEGGQKAGSEQRKAYADAMRKNSKGVIKAIKDGEKDWKLAGSGFGKHFSGRDSSITAQEKAVMKRVVMGMGGTIAAVHIGESAGEQLSNFIKSVANHYIEKIAMFKGGLMKKAEGDALASDGIAKFYEEFVNFIENGEVDEKVWKKNKPKDMNTEDIKKTDIDLLRDLGLDEDMIRKAGIPKDKSKLVPIKKHVQKKGKVYTQTFWVSPEEAKEYQKTGKLNVKKINANADVNAGSDIGAVINTLVNNYAKNTGKLKGDIWTDVGTAAGYHIKDDGTLAGKDAPKAVMYKIKQGQMIPKPEALEGIAKFFNMTASSLNKMAESQGDALQEIKGKVDEVDLNELAHKIGDYDYDMIEEVISDSSTSKDEKIDFLLKAGIRDSGKIQDMLGLESWRDIYDYMESEGYEENEDDGFDMNKLRKFGFKSDKKNTSLKWDAYIDGLNMVANGDVPFLVAFGKGGIGKTYHATKVMKEREMKSFPFDGSVIPGSADYDYVRYGGRSGVGEMVKMLFEHNGKLIIFDDFDSVLTNENGIDILKNAFDTDVKQHVITYGSQKLTTDAGAEVPKTFIFTGKAVVLTNLEMKDVPQPIQTRALIFDLTMNRKERMDKIKEIYPKMELRDADGKLMEIPMEIRQQAFDFLDRWKYSVDTSAIQPRQFSSLAKYMQYISLMDHEQKVNKYGKDYDKEGGRLDQMYFNLMMKG